MNGECKGCEYETVRKYKVSLDEYESPACKAEIDVFESCMKIKQKFTTLPVWMGGG